MDEKKAIGLGVTGAAFGTEGDRDAMAGAKDGLVHPGEVVTVLVSFIIPRLLFQNVNDATLNLTRSFVHRSGPTLRPFPTSSIFGQG